MHHPNSRSVTDRPWVSCAGRTVRWALCDVAVAATFYLLAFGRRTSRCSTNPTWTWFLEAGEVVLRSPASVRHASNSCDYGPTLDPTIRSETKRRLASCRVAVFAVPLDTIVFLKLRGRQDERIHLDWRKESAVFSWGTGQAKMPAGFTYAREIGIDTFVCLFPSEDGSLVIEHDIGELAAEHGGMGDMETLIEGSRVRFGRVTHDDEKGGKEYFL